MGASSFTMLNARRGAEEAVRATDAMLPLASSAPTSVGSDGSAVPTS